jgi:hypothetical protein
MGLFILGVAATFFGAQQRALRVQNTYAESQNVTRYVHRPCSRASCAWRRSIRAEAALVPANDPTGAPNTDRASSKRRRPRSAFRQDLNGDGDVTDTGE